VDGGVGGYVSSAKCTCFPGIVSNRGVQTLCGRYVGADNLSNQLAVGEIISVIAWSSAMDGYDSTYSISSHDSPPPLRHRYSGRQ
jgi:hypothetical protein